MKLLRLFLFAIVAFVANSDKQSSSIYWISNNSGLFSQFLQIKIIYLLAKKIGKKLINAPITSKHYGEDEVDLCTFFSFPEDVTCGYVPKNLQCSESLPDDYDTTKSDICYSGTVKFGLVTKARRYILKAIDAIDLPLRFNAKNAVHYHEFKKAIGLNELNNNSFTVVHWRRGDQLKSRCGGGDKSVNCGTAEDLIRKVRRNSKDKFVFVATNEPQDSRQMDTLRSKGFKTFSDAGNENPIFKNMSLFEILTLESLLMMESTTFLGWGVTEINDLVEYDRFLRNKTHCIDQDDVDSDEQMTWCALKGFGHVSVKMENEADKRGPRARHKNGNHNNHNNNDKVPFIDTLLNITTPYYSYIH